MSIKECCADFYQTDLVRLFFGDSMHPGGLELTKELGNRIGIAKESKVLDAACGRGATAIFIAKNFGCHVTGIDLSGKNIEKAKAISKKEGISEITDFRVGDVENIIDFFTDETFDYVICECSFCLFDDKKKAAEELYRVTRKKGKIGISDIVVRSEVQQSLKDALNRFLCILEAKSENEYKEYLEDAGFVNIQFYDNKQKILKLLDDIMKRIFAAELLKGLGKLELNNVDFNKTKNIIKEVKGCVNSNIISYALIIGDK